MLNYVAFYGLARILSGLLLYLSFVAALYGLDKQQYQYFSVSYPMYQIIAMICFGWITGIMPSLFAGVTPEIQHRAEQQVLRAYGWMVLTAVTILSIVYATGGIDIPLSLVIMLTGLIIIASGGDGVLVLVNAQERHRTYLFLSLVRYGVALILMLAVYLMPSLGAAGALGALALGAALSIAMWWRQRERHVGRIHRVQWREIGSLIAIGLPAMVAFSVYQLSMSASRLIIAQGCSLATAATLGGVNDLLTGPLLMIFQVINMAFNPKLYAAANQGNLSALRKVAFTVIGVQLAVIVPTSLFLLVAGQRLGALLLSDRLGPLASSILPYVGLATLLSVSLNTSIGVALARKKAGMMAFFSLAVIAAALALAFFRGCDLVEFTQGFTLLMALSGCTGLALIYGLTRPLPAK